MADEPEQPERFLSRWSKRKHEAARSATTAPVVATDAPAVAAPLPGPVAAPEPLPPVESLTIDSDFSAFLQPSVAADVRRAALSKLFADPRFNVMDGLDVYIDDYTKPDPMPEGMLDKLKDVYRTLTQETAEPPAADSNAATPEAASPEAPVPEAPVPAAPPPDPPADPQA